MLLQRSFSIEQSAAALTVAQAGWMNNIKTLCKYDFLHILVITHTTQGHRQTDRHTHRIYSYCAGDPGDFSLTIATIFKTISLTIHPVSEK